MGKVYIKVLTTVYESDENGRKKEFKAGDWISVGKQRAIELIESGQATSDGSAQAETVMNGELADCGILVRVGPSEKALSIIADYKLGFEGGELGLPFARTLIWNSLVPLSSRQVTLGFCRVEERKGQYNSWEVAAMLRSNDMLASQFGEMADQERTLEAIGDLRIALYETGAIWIRKTTTTHKLIHRWKVEMQTGGSEELAFLRALYHTRPLLCSLPAQWLRQWRRPKA